MAKAPVQDVATTPQSAQGPTAAAPPSGFSVLPPPGTEKVLYLIDLSGYVFRAYHALPPLSSAKGEPTHAVLGTVNMLQKVVGERRPRLLAIAMDSRGPSFRHAIDVRYKATRPAPPPDLAMQMARCEQIVRAYNIPIHASPGVEADDLIACAVARAIEEGLRVVIVSSDKDLMQLVRDDDDRVLLWDSMRDKVYGAPEVRAKFGVKPSQMRDLLALTGDTSDNVPGVPSVGPKTASDLLNEYGTLDGIYANLDKIKRAKLREMLTTHEADARVSQRLVTLQCDTPLAWDLAELTYGGADLEALRALFLELEFTRLLDSVRALASGGAGGAGGAASTRSPASASWSSAPKVERSTTSTLDLAAVQALVARAREVGSVAVHLETTGVDVARADILGVALAVTPGQGIYVPLAHRYLGAPRQPTWAELRGVLAPLMADAKVRKVGHDLKHVEIVLARHGVPLEGGVFDTALASYLLDPETNKSLKDLSRRELNLELVPYEEAVTKKGAPFDQIEVEKAAPFAAAIPATVLELAERFEPRLEREGMGKLMNEVELPLSRILAQMERIGVLVDVPTLETVGRRLEGTLRQLEADAKRIVGHDFAVRSRDQLEKILFDELKLPVLKRTPKGGRSTDAAVLEELAEQHELPRVVCEFRELDKLKGTYLDALPRCVNPETGRIHTRFDQTVAATGRLSSSDPNLQNIPIRTEVGREIRAAFVAPPGHRLVSADYSQIELRVLAHLSQDEQLMEAFRTDEDVHLHTAALVFGVTKTEVTREMRGRAKTINFGVIYGMGDSALAKQLGITREEAARFIAAYFDRYKGVARFMEQTIQKARDGEAVRSLLGRRRFLPNLHSPNRGLRFEAERIAKNTPIQGTAADILKLAMVKLGGDPVVPGARMILTVHDELVFEVPAERVAEAKERIREAMQGAIRLAVPLVVDVGDGANWNEAH